MNTILGPIILLLSISYTPAQDSIRSKLSATTKVCESNTQKVTLIVSNPTSQRFTIDVYSKEEGYLFSRTVNTGDFKANLDFSTAPDGDYNIDISCRNGERIRKTVNIHTNEVVTRVAALK